MKDAMQRLLDPAQLARLHAQAAGRPVDLRVLLNAAEVALAEERYADAETILHGAVVAAPDRADIWNRLGQVAEAFGDIDDAMQAYRRAMDLGEDDHVALDLARLLASSGEFAPAAALATALAEETESAFIRNEATALVTALERRKARHAAR